jgi:uncharacterized protein YwgA
VPEDKIDITHILALILNRLDIDFSTIENDIDVRKKIQKSIYILQLEKFDFNLGYRYNLYLAGPYSPELSDDYYKLAADSTMYSQIVQSLNFQDFAERKITEFKNTFRGNYELLECFSTLHFLITNTFSYIDDSTHRMEKAKNHLFKIKLDFKRKTPIVDEALRLISEFQ